MTGRNIVLIGFMGTGKTSAGKRLADRLGYTFVDTDREIEARSGKSIVRLFEDDGESSFRNQESIVIEEMSSRPNSVISTGGGAVMRPKNLRRLKSSGLMVCLTASPEAIFQRIQATAARPLLNVADPLGEIHRLLALRRPAYAEAHLTVETSSTPVEQIVTRILEAYRHFLQEGS